MTPTNNHEGPKTAETIISTWTIKNNYSDFGQIGSANLIRLVEAALAEGRRQGAEEQRKKDIIVCDQHLVGDYGTESLAEQNRIEGHDQACVEIKEAIERQGVVGSSQIERQETKEEGRWDSNEALVGEAVDSNETKILSPNEHEAVEDVGQEYYAKYSVLPMLNRTDTQRWHILREFFRNIFEEGRLAGIMEGLKEGDKLLQEYMESDERAKTPGQLFAKFGSKIERIAELIRTRLGEGEK